MLLVRALNSGYSGKLVVQDVDLEVGAGQIVAVIGPNGAGKSTLLKTIMGFVRADSGLVAIDGRRLDDVAPEGRIRAGMAYVAQSGGAFPSLSVQENLAAGGYLIREKGVLAERLESVYSRFPVLRELRRSQAAKLSGGERRMLEVGRFLMQAPRIVLLDEPSIGLAPAVAMSVYANIRELAEDGLSFLIVEQNVRLALEVAEYVYVLELGRNRFEGPPRALEEDAQLGSLFLGASASGSGMKAAQ